VAVCLDGAFLFFDVGLTNTGGNQHEKF